MAPSPGRRGPARGHGRPAPATGDPGNRAARSLRPLAEEAERDRSDAEQQARLLRRAAGGDHAAEEALFNENLAMVLRTAHRAVPADGSSLTEDELLQEGSLALIAAIKGYADSGRDDFRAYAEAEVQAAIARAQAEDAGAENGKRQLVADAEAYERAEVSIRRAKGRDATLGELAEKLEWSRAKTQRLGELIAEARREHDQDILNYLDPADLADPGDE